MIKICLQMVIIYFSPLNYSFNPYSSILYWVLCTTVGCETVDLSARSVLSMIDLTASGDYSTNNKKRLDKHHNLRSSGKKFHRDRSSKFSLTTTNTSPDTSRKVKKKKNKISTTTTTTTTTTIHSHDSNSCSLTTNENMIYSSCLFSPSINPQVCIIYLNVHKCIVIHNIFYIFCVPM